jgi:hypothetical protein
LVKYVASTFLKIGPVKTFSTRSLLLWAWDCRCEKKAMVQTMTNHSQKGLPPVVRGAIIGGSIGLMATWFGLDLTRAFFLGIFCGVLGAITAQRIQQKRRNK